MQKAFKVKKVRTIFIVYWILLAYIVAALVWWFIALNLQNKNITEYKLQQTRPDDFFYARKQQKILEDEKRKTVQYIGEGATFFLLISLGAIFVYRATRRQFRQSRQQQNFMMAVTHELKTPISITKLNLETLQKHTLEKTQQQKIISATVQEANRLNDLCNNLLLSSQIEANGYMPTDEIIELGDLITAASNEYKTRFNSREIEVQKMPDVFVEGDLLLLQMAVNNLLDNAIKYSPRQSKISLAVGKENNQAFIKVMDEGDGIAEAEKKKIFQKFYRVGNLHTRQAKGTGLGLYLTKKIVEIYKGSITVLNNHPAGTIFVIYLKQHNGQQ